MTDELYINGSLVDTEDVEIVRTYRTPFFSDVTQLKNDGTLTIRLPLTARNTAVFEACFRTDFVSDLPYDFLYADYYFNGLPIFLHAEVRILNVDVFIEIQCVYGVNRELLLPLFEKKLNETVINGTTITESDWVVNWRKENTIYATGKKFVYLDSLSGERTSDVDTVSDVPQPAVLAPAPFYQNLKEMTQHPFVSFENVIDLIVSSVTTEETLTADTDIVQDTIQFDEDIIDISVGSIVKTIDGNDATGLGIKVIEIVSANTLKFNQDVSDYFTTGDSWVFVATTMTFSELDDLNARLIDKGMILSGDKGNKKFSKTQTYAGGAMGINGTFDLDSYIGSFVISSITNNFGILSEILYNDKSMLNINIDMTITNDGLDEMQVSLYERVDAVETKIYDFPYTVNDFDTIYECDYKFKAEYGKSYLLKYANSGGGVLSANSTITISQDVQNPLYSMIETESVTTGYYDCILNLPDITPMQFIQQLLIHTGLFMGYDSTGTLKVFSLDNFKDNIDNGDVIDWTGKVSNIRKGTFQFNSNAQKNYIKFNNDKDLQSTRKETIEVNDKTLDTEKDLYVLDFDSPLGNVDEKSEFILYEQSVKRSGEDGVSFENKYVGDKWQNGLVVNDDGVAKNIAAANPTYYAVYKKLVERPLVVECDVNLGLYESARIDFEKPVYCDEIGRYCLLLELQAPKYDVCVAKLLIVNQKL